MSKVRVYEVAKQLGIDEQATLTLLQAQGAPVRNRLSAVEQDVADRARRALERSKSASVVEERIRPTVVRRKATPKAEPISVATPAAAPQSTRTNGHGHGAPLDDDRVSARMPISREIPPPPEA